MTEYAEDIARWFQVNAGKLIWLTIVLAIVFVADRVISRVLRKILDNSQIPSASIFVNLTRGGAGGLADAAAPLLDRVCHIFVGNILVEFQ